MTEQMALFKHPDPAGSKVFPPDNEGAHRRDKGIKRAIQHAEKINDGWQDKALEWLYNYARNHHEFQIEDVRMASKGIIPEGCHGRAWGGIARKAAAMGWISKMGTDPVSNPTAHCAYAVRWKSNL